ncbi:NAD-binding protein [Fomitiporia mediterranea MF3/22]|uniref:NAD-binding protein n=1 Tax=Fomitiporia mediterranea (strain MF3/22) TaxID=694068 RepID=UPI0004407FAB|nr:NAD-binding protein [Fomitiporia mediterranea MF3/22]EJD00921.1 NAD-binding protein [Fomitiporia mediterranea MF3/22]
MNGVTINNGISNDGSPAMPVTLAIIGCGQRGSGYAEYALKAPDKCKVVAIAEPRPKTRTAMIAEHAVDPSLVFNTWEELHAASAESLKTCGKRLADAIVVAVQDRMHCSVVLAFATQGYDLLCEKPMATTIEDCVRMADAVKKVGIIFGMGHVLRYSPYSRAMSEVIHSGSLGKLINIQHLEPVGYYHFAHSYVRGNWCKEEDACFSLMTKSSHDIDIICSMLAPATPIRVTSFGSLQHFKKSEKPPAAGSATRCLDCPIESECPYSAKSIYLDRVKNGYKGWPSSTIVDGVPDIENITEALQTGPYGKCVYESDNDVVDNQVVNIEFSSGATVSFTMVAFTTLICDRQTRLHFTHGEIVGDMESFTVTDFRVPKLYNPQLEGGGHGGGDLGLISTFVEAVRTRKQDVLGVDVEGILRSHLTVFAAEKSRREGCVVNVADFEKEMAARFLGASN